MTSVGPADTSQVTTYTFVRRQLHNKLVSRASTQPHDEITEKRHTWNKKAEEIINNINMRKCAYYIASTKSESDGMCQCGYWKEDHDDDATDRPKQEQSQQDLKWRFEKHSTTVPTNAFGEIEFVEFIGNNAKFVRLNINTNIGKLLMLMKDVWKMDTPKLVISVIGGEENFNMTPHLRHMLLSDLVNAARKTDAWIITGGTHVGVAKHIGEAVRYSRFKSENQKDIVVIGIAPWGVIHNKKLLENKMQSEPQQYRIHVKDKPNEHERFLNPNHSHFLLVDNGTQHQFETETTLRVALENHLKSTSVVLLVIDGGPHILKRVRNALSNDIPVIIVKGSGQVADLLVDLLAYALENAEESEFVDRDFWGKSIMKKKKSLKQNQKLYISELMKKTKFCERTAISDNIEGIDACLDKFQLINIFDLGGGDQDLYNAMCNAVLKAKESDGILQVAVALNLNLIDVARSAILTAEKGWEPDTLARIMLVLLNGHKVDMVEMLLDSGVNMKKCLTPRSLMYLYHNMTYKDSIFSYLCHNLKKKKKKISRRISMKTVGIVITDLLDDYYLPQYRLYPGKDETEDETEDEAEDETANAPFENPFLHLLIWAVLNNLQDMAKLCWRKGLDSIATALLAHALLSAMASRIKKEHPNLYDDIEANSRAFMDLATGVLERCYRTNKTKALDLLIGDLLEWEKASCILIAMKTNNKTFISATACQEVFNNVWMGEMTQDNSILKLLMCICIPPLIPICVNFKESERDFLYAILENIWDKLIIEDLKDEDGQSSDETEMPQSRPSPNYSEDKTQGNHKDSDVSISNEGERPIIKGTSTQIGQANEDTKAGVSSANEPLLQRSSSRSTEDSSERERDETMEYFRKAKKKILLFYRAPVVHFLSHVISYMAFVCLYSYVLISKFDQNVSVEDVILIVWVVNIFIDEIRQVIATRYIYSRIKLKAYIADLRNITDIVMILLFVIGIILKRSFLEAARVILSVNLIICFLRLLQMFSLKKEVGPKLVMIIRMVRNLTSFFVMLLIFIVAYAIASHAILYPNTEISFNFLRVVFRRPYWNIYGELMLDEIEGTNDCTNIVELYRNGTQPRCPTESGKYVVPVLMGIYMLMCNILLLNLLISIFSNTFQMVQENADKHWRIQRYHHILEYTTRSMFVPPISFIEVVIKILALLRKCKRKPENPENKTSRPNVFFKRFPDEFSRDTVRKWERTIAQDIINSKKAVLKIVENSGKAITPRQDHFVSKNALQDQQHTGTATIEDVRSHPSQIDCVAKSESSTVYEPGSVTSDQRMDNIEKKLQWIVDRLNEHQPGDEQASPEKTDERVEVQPFSAEDLPDTVRKWERTIAQDSTNSNKADLKSIDDIVKAITLRLDVRLDQLFSKIDEEHQHALTANIGNARLHPSQTDCVAKSESSTVDEPGSVTIYQRMDNGDEQIPWINDTPEEH